MSPDWSQTIPVLNLVVGSPVKFREGQEPVGFPCSGRSMFVRPWGDNDNGMCMVVDEEGTSMPVTEACLMLDLEHPLGMLYGLSLLYQAGDVPEWKNAFGWQSVCARALNANTDGRDRNDLAKALGETLNTHKE